MVNVDEAVIAKIKKENKKFEILVDCDNALKIKQGMNMDMKDVLAAEEIFSDSTKGMKASEHELKNIFNTADVLEIAKKIICEGEVQLTAAHRKRIREEKRRQIIEIIRTNGIDPRTNIPHPPTRIENALEEAKVKIDELRPAQEQVERILKELRLILPIKLAVQEIAVKIPAGFATKSYSLLKKYGKLKSEEWQNDGSLLAITELPAGLHEEYASKLNTLTKGSVEIKILKTK